MFSRPRCAPHPLAVPRPRSVAFPRRAALARAPLSACLATFALLAAVPGLFAQAPSPPATPAPAPSAADAAIDAVLMDIMSRNRPASQSLVRGTVVDVDGNVVVGAAIQFVRDDLRHGARTDENGSFTLAAIPSGTYRMTVEHLAYQTAQDDVEVAGGGVVTHARVVLSREVLAIGGIEVVVDQRPTFGTLAPVYDRVEFQRSLGNGRFFDRREIEDTNPSRITDMLGQVAGIRVQGDQAILNTVTPGCGAPVFYVDGAKISLTWQDLRMMIPVSQIEMMEIYRRPAEIPAEFSGSDAACGVLAIWTRRGGF